MKEVTNTQPLNNTKGYSCPLCDSPLASMPGSQLDPKDGVTIWCPSVKCPAQEVFGHGKNEKEAFDIVISKYKKS